MSQADVRDGIEEVISYLKSVSIGAIIFCIITAIFYGVSIALGATPETGISTEKISVAETFGFFAQMIATFAGMIAILCAMMAAGTTAVLVCYALVLMFTPATADDRADKQRRSYRKVKRQE